MQRGRGWRGQRRGRSRLVQEGQAQSRAWRSPLHKLLCVLQGQGSCLEVPHWLGAGGGVSGCAGSSLQVPASWITGAQMPSSLGPLGVPETYVFAFALEEKRQTGHRSREVAWQQKGHAGSCHCRVAPCDDKGKGQEGARGEPLKEPAPSGVRRRDEEPASSRCGTRGRQWSAQVSEGCA